MSLKSSDYWIKRPLIWHLKRTRTRPQETIEIKINRSQQTFSCNIPSELEENRWVVGVTILEIFSTVFNKMENIINFWTFLVLKKIGLQLTEWKLVAKRSENKATIKNENRIKNRGLTVVLVILSWL